MIPGKSEPHVRTDFQAGLDCGVAGCTRRARHEWAYPCAVTTMADDPAAPRWLPVCDECDLELNRVLLSVVGVPAHVLGPLLAAYRQIQADGAFDHATGEDDDE